MIRWQGRPEGMGVIITQLSFYLACGPAEVVVPNANNLLFDIKRIWQIPDHELKIIVGENIGGIENLQSDELCTYVPYLYKPTVKVWDREFPVGRRNKPCVALCMHHGNGLGEDLAVRSMPYNKYATAAEYQQIFDKLCGMGYDVITLNRSDINIEQKVFLLNELCEFVIGYEGGLQQLAHCLKIPCVVLPWRYNDMGGDPVYPGMYYETHRFHPDRKTYFLKHTQDFLEMSKDQVRQLITDLHNDLGNNILFSPEVFLDPTTLGIQHRGHGMDLTPRLCWCETFGERTVQIIREHLPVENMRRYPIDQK